MGLLALSSYGTARTKDATIDLTIISLGFHILYLVDEVGAMVENVSLKLAT